MGERGLEQILREWRCWKHWTG